MSTLHIGISTCPNDTFAFAGILEGMIDLEGLEIELVLADIQQLNTALRERRLDAGKASFHAALHLASQYGILRAGAAIGKGVGPLLLSSPTASGSPRAGSRVLCPGEWTTATLLLQILFPEVQQIEHALFSEIMPALQTGRADFGVVIHEGRFTYEEYGLRSVTDLGDRWEQEFSPYLPLGGILARTDLPEDVHSRLCSVIRRSIEFGYANKDIAYEVMQRYAAELDRSVIWKHVELYVTELTNNVGIEGAQALKALADAAHNRAGLAEVRLELLG
jgi:1,4-dihydroxy-6-naphthoate synthase